MSTFVTSLAIAAMVLFILNVYQYLTQKAVLRIADILYIMSRNVREKAAEVRRDRKDVEIIEAHLFDIATSARSLLRALGRSEESLGPDPTIDLSPNGNRLNSCLRTSTPPSGKREPPTSTSKVEQWLKVSTRGRRWSSAARARAV